ERSSGLPSFSSSGHVTTQFVLSADVLVTVDSTPSGVTTNSLRNRGPFWPAFGRYSTAPRTSNGCTKPALQTASYLPERSAIRSQRPSSRNAGAKLTPPASVNAPSAGPSLVSQPLRANRTRPSGVQRLP